MVKAEKTLAGEVPVVKAEKTLAGEVPMVKGENTIGATRWLALKELQYLDQNGTERQWNMVQRTTKSDTSDVDAVAIFATLKGGDLRTPSTLLVRQFRPPVNAYTIELPAGLIDANETPHAAALRELKEETGYVATVTGISTPLNMSPGLTDEKVCIVSVLVDLDKEENMNPVTSLEEGEFVQTLVVPLPGLVATLEDYAKRGDSVNYGVHSIAVGLSIKL